MTQGSQKQEGVIHEEIKELERMLEEKKRIALEREEAHEPKEAFREAFKEKYLPAQEILTPVTPALPGTPPASSSDIQKRDDELRKRTREEQVAALIEISFEKGIREAIKIARRATPWLLDELHDRLIDEYYQKLVQARQITGSS